VFLLNIVVRLQWANGFSFLVFLIDYIAGLFFLPFVRKRSVWVWTMWSFGTIISVGP
jgi:hypothetical protein